MENSVTLRPVGPGDEVFLFELYASTRQEELAPVGWSEEQQASFLQMQFSAQSHWYKSEYPGAVFKLIEVEGQPAGRLYVHHRQNEVRIMDIALLPQYRRRGIGTALVKEVLSEGAQSGKPVTIHVEGFNPALRLYERLGFKKVADNGPYHLMEWLPKTTAHRSVGEPEPASQCA